MQSKVVLCVEEYDVPEIGRRKYNIDTRMFVYYDNENGVFRIFGKRQEVKTQMSTFVPYAFQTENIGAVQNFIKMTIDPETKVSVTLFNFNDLYDTAEDDATYEYFEQSMDSLYIIAAYDDVKLTRRHLSRMLSLVKSF